MKIETEKFGKIMASNEGYKQIGTVVITLIGSYRKE
jgi:hypothetical protein